jgi:signal transduction histidine kinase
MLAEIDRAKTVFFSNVSHEFRTPLTLMLNPLEDVLSSGNLPTAEREQITVAHRNSLRLLKLVNTLLDFSRIEADRIQAVYEPIDLATLTADLASVFRSAIEKAGLQLVVDCPPLIEPVYVDRDMWEKIVLNLLSNAFKFTFEGEISVSLHPVADAVELVVQDTGTGIPTRELPHLFERFHRVAGAQGRSYEGSGIGLSLVQELVNLHGGTVAVSSVLDEGSTFVVRLPMGFTHLPPECIQAPRTQTSTASGAISYIEEALGWVAQTREDSSSSGEALPHRSSARILLADDNADMRHYLQRLLSEHYDVEAVAMGKLPWKPFASKFQI